MFRRHTRRSARRHAIATLLSLTAAASLSAAGCSEDEKATPQAIFDGTLQRVGSGLDPEITDCPDTGPLFLLGAFGTPGLAEDDPNRASRPVKDGEADRQGTAQVICSVTPAGPDQFNVSASVTLSGALGGVFTLRQATVSTVGDQTGINAMFAKRTPPTNYSQADGGCTIRYTSAFQGVAPGRIWGEIECPAAVNAGAQTACKVVAQFRLENCDQ